MYTIRISYWERLSGTKVEQTFNDTIDGWTTIKWERFNRKIKNIIQSVDLYQQRKWNTFPEHTQLTVHRIKIPPNTWKSSFGLNSTIWHHVIQDYIKSFGTIGIGSSPVSFGKHACSPFDSALKPKSRQDNDSFAFVHIQLHYFLIT